MNKIITTHANYRGQIIPISELKEQSQVKVEVECKHGRRKVRWCRRNQLCKKCTAESGAYSSSLPGRKITWGDKISRVKKGVKFSDAHKEALIKARKKKIAQKLNKSINDVQFPTKGTQYKLRIFLMNALRKNILSKTVDYQDKLFLEKLGYSVDEFKKHLESQFEPWMNWDNYGEWEIDHIKPESWFNYQSVDSNEFRSCWSLNNLQPMKAENNRKKNNLYQGQFKEKVIYLLCGQSGVGKSTVAAQLNDLFTVIDKDDFKRLKDLDTVIRNNWHNELQILLQVSVHISTTIKRYTQQGYKVVPFFIIEEPDIVKQRIETRGGNRIKNVDDRYNRVVSVAAEYATYCATADNMLQYIWSQYGKKTT